MGTAIPFDLSHHRTRRVPVLCTFVLHTPSFGSPAAIPSLSVDTDYFHSFNATIRVKELHSPQRAVQSFQSAATTQYSRRYSLFDLQLLRTNTFSNLPIVSQRCNSQRLLFWPFAPHLLLHTLPPSVPSPSIISMARVLLSWAAWTPLSILVLRPAMFTPSKVVMRSL